MTLTPQASRAEYARRMNRVLNYIDQHLDQPLELAQLADVANFSRFHFHRIFVAWMGETLGDYARRRRLEKAAFLLASGTAASVLDTALSTGFGSGEAFARAFKQKFGCTPSEWRNSTPARLAGQAARIGQGLQSNPDQVLRNPGQAGGAPFSEDGDSLTSNGDYAMEVNVIDLPAARVAYQRRIGAYGPGIGAFWRGTVAPWIQAHGLTANTCYGVGYDDPSITPADKCRYDACVEVPADFASGQQADIMTLPGGRYAVARFQAPTTAIHEAWMWLTREWLPSSGLQCDDRPCFERFDASTGLNPQTGLFTCDICIPVRAL